MLRTMQKLIETDADITEGVAALHAECEVMRRIIPLTGAPPLRRQRYGLDGLCWIVIGQQVSVAAGNAIWNKLVTNFPERSPEIFLSATDEAMRASGLSAPKIRTIRAISEAMALNALDLDALAALSADEAKQNMVKIKGIGPWTADVYLMFCLGHADAFAPGDLALQEAIRLASRLDDRPTDREAGLIAERWRPWRAVAARILWAYYKIAKEREGVGL
ncbi:MAG: DNA-3-methyladenine glycosylase family protein [Beijerinckiaceae bacterium]